MFTFFVSDSNDLGFAEIVTYLRLCRYTDAFLWRNKDEIYVHVPPVVDLRYKWSKFIHVTKYIII